MTADMSDAYLLKLMRVPDEFERLDLERIDKLCNRLKIPWHTLYGLRCPLCRQ